MNDIEKAIEDCNKKIDGYKNDYKCWINECKIEETKLNALEKQLTNGWISISTLPKEDGTYLVAWLQRGCKSLCDYPHYYGMFEFTDGKFDIDVPNGFKGYEIIILAWQPLPGSYKEESK